MLEVTRKKPIQARAVHTVEILLDAAAQVLEHEGEAHFTTNRVAETAGFSIGTLYQYFPNKHSIITALVSREQDRARSILHRAIARAAPQDVESIVRIVVRTCLNALGGRRRARRALIFQMIRLNQGLEFLRGMDELTKGIVEAMTARGLAGVRPLSDSATFILTRAIMGVIRSAVVEESPLIGGPAFEEELVRMALLFVKQ